MGADFQGGAMAAGSQGAGFQGGAMVVDSQEGGLVLASGRKLPYRLHLSLVPKVFSIQYLHQQSLTFEF